jgi:hypothetical protein
MEAGPQLVLTALNVTRGRQKPVEYQLSLFAYCCDFVCWPVGVFLYENVAGIWVPRPQGYAPDRICFWKMPWIDILFEITLAWNEVITRLVVFEGFVMILLYSIESKYRCFVLGHTIQECGLFRLMFVQAPHIKHNLPTFIIQPTTTFILFQ